MHVRPYYVLAIIGLIFILISPAFAEEPQFRSVNALKAVGFNSCLGRVSDITKHLYEKDSFAYLNFWSKQDTDRHTAITLTSMPYEQGTRIAGLSVSPTSSGSCDGTLFQVFVVPESCAKLRETLLKNWKYYADLGNIPFYEEPDMPSSVTGLVSIPTSSCLILKVATLYFPVESKK
jgi:hypothetical protein